MREIRIFIEISFKSYIIAIEKLKNCIPLCSVIPLLKDQMENSGFNNEIKNKCILETRF